jgi:hypothetical protein
MQVDVRGLRTLSAPLDWLTIEPKQLENGLKSWEFMIENRFQVEFRPEDLSIETVTETSCIDYLGDILLVDKKRGLLFPHDFQSWPASKATIADVQAKYNRRCVHVCEALSKGGQWLFVFNNGAYVYTENDVLRFVAKLRQNFPLAQIDIFAVLFNANQEVYEKEIAPGVFVAKTCRKFKDRLDFGSRDKIWNWLDTIQIRNNEYARHGRSMRIHANDQRVLEQVSRWLTVDKKTLKVYYKMYKQSYGRGYCRFREESWWRCRLPMWLWLKTRKRCFLKLVIALKKA